jgi:hypothetical protein
MRNLVGRIAAAMIGLCVVASAALADAPQITASNKACVTITLTTGSAYVAGNVVGGLLQIPALTRVAPATVNSLTAVMESMELKFQESHSEEYDVTPFETAPATVFTDKAAPAISGADALNAQVPIKLTNNTSLMGSNSTVYGVDGIGRVIKILDGIGRFLITTPGTPTFTASTAKLCVGALQD